MLCYEVATSPANSDNRPSKSEQLRAIKVKSGFANQNSSF